MVLFHETRPQRGSTSDNAAPAATNKELDVEAMITEIIMEKVLKDPESPDKGEPTRSGTSCMTLRRVGDKLHLNCNFCNFRYISSTIVTVTKLLFKSNFPNPGMFHHPAWAVGSYSISQSAKGTTQI